MSGARSPWFPLVLAGPSGGGKTTVRAALLERRSDVRFSVSATTRAPRPGERQGQDYQFIDRGRFERLVEEGELLEWAEVHGHLYGTPRENLRRAREDGLHLLLDIDVQGARQLRKLEPDAVTVFLLPPSLDELVERLRGRGSEDAETLRKRMRTALAELSAVHEFDYVIVNDALEETIRRVDAILTSEECRWNRLSETVARHARELSESLTRALAEPAPDIYGAHE